VNTKGQPWYPGETVITSIGQGYMLATPLQLAMMTSHLATQGQTYQPRMVRATRTVGEEGWQPVAPVPMAAVEVGDTRHWQVITQAMQDVIHAPHGTARAIAKGIAYNMAGKTGTAQVFSIAQDAEYDEETVPENLRDHSLFVAFAPVENPQIALAVIVENGGGGSITAAPIARQLIDSYLLREKYLASH
jgi:penicillin-binding protein 2